MPKSDLRKVSSQSWPIVQPHEGYMVIVKHICGALIAYTTTHQTIIRRIDRRYTQQLGSNPAIGNQTIGPPPAGRTDLNNRPLVRLTTGAIYARR